jgi:hypothetical protein
MMDILSGRCRPIVDVRQSGSSPEPWAGAVERTPSSATVADPRRRPSDTRKLHAQVGADFLSISEALVSKAKPDLPVELVPFVRVSVPEELDDVADAVQQLAELLPRVVGIRERDRSKGQEQGHQGR